MPLIIDFEMPNNCQTCPMRDQAMCKAGLFDITTNEDLEERHPDCPIRGELLWSDLHLLNYGLYQNAIRLHDILEEIRTKKQSEFVDIPKQDIIGHISEQLAETSETGKRLLEIIKDNTYDDNDFYDTDDEDYDDFDNCDCDCSCGHGCSHLDHGHDDEKILPFRRKDS